MKYKEIRNEYQNHNYLQMVFVDVYASKLSPIFTKIFLKFNVIPNYVTILMIISGIVGAFLFAIPNIIFKVIGILFIHLWYILDCSDGEVARITKKFSKFGKEIDLTAHVINHPLFNLAFSISILNENRYNSSFILILFMIYISTDLIVRNSFAFDIIFMLKTNNNETKPNTNSLLKKIIVYIFNALTQYPNFALIFPIIYLIDWRLKSSLCLAYLIVATVLNVLFVSRSCFNWVKKIKDL